MTDGHHPIQWPDPLPTEHRPGRRVRARARTNSRQDAVEPVVRPESRPRDRDSRPRDPETRPTDREIPEIDDGGLTLGNIIEAIIVGTIRTVMGVCWAFFSAIAYLARRYNR